MGLFLWLLLFAVVCCFVYIYTSNKSSQLMFGGSEMNTGFGLTEKYSSASATRLGYVAYAAYFASINQPEMNKWLNLAQLQTSNPVPFRDSSTEIVGFVSQVGASSLLVAFTGTQVYNLPETVLDDLYVLTSDYPPTGGSVSDGFADSWSSIRSNVVSAITPSIKEVWFVGHSLGGAVATLAAADIKHSYPDIKVVIYTYASPRVGDQDFVNGYQNLGIITNRIQNYWDLIPRLPLEGWGYVHVSPLILLSSNGDSATCIYDATPPDNYLKDPFDWVYEHSLDRYLGLLKAC